jgi:Cu/Ag efflux pump CusA
MDVLSSRRGGATSSEADSNDLFAFILGVFPLVLSSGAGAEMRRSLGAAVFGGMLSVTLFGIFFTPVLYVVIRRLTARKKIAAPA